MAAEKCIMAIGGHIGDAELTCGGVLASMSLEGYKVITVALTGGEKGNPPGMSVAEYRVQKESEAKTFAEMMGGEVRQQHRSATLPACLFFLGGVIIANDTLNTVIDALCRKHAAVPIGKDEA